MRCRDCEVEAAPKYRERCPRCGGELVETFDPWDAKITFGGVEIKGYHTGDRLLPGITTTWTLPVYSEEAAADLAEMLSEQVRALLEDC